MLYCFQIERLREEGSRLLQEQQEALQEQLKREKEQNKKNRNDEFTARLRVGFMIFGCSSTLLSFFIFLNCKLYCCTLL